jgi:hypothetical protein
MARPSSSADPEMIASMSCSWISRSILYSALGLDLDARDTLDDVEQLQV